MRFKSNAEQAEWVERRLKSLGHDVLPTWTNFT